MNLISPFPPCCHITLHHLSIHTHTHTHTVESLTHTLANTTALLKTPGSGSWNDSVELKREIEKNGDGIGLQTVKADTHTETHQREKIDV